MGTTGHKARILIGLPIKEVAKMIATQSVRTIWTNCKARHERRRTHKEEQYKNMFIRMDTTNII